MTMTHNQTGNHLNSVGPSFWVVRLDGTILSYHRKSGQAARWLASHTHAIAGGSMAVCLDLGYKVTKSYTAVARYVSPRSDGPVFDPEWVGEFETFSDAMDGTRGWVHRSWEQDRNNHPSPSGRSQVWERWNDVDVLLNISALSLIPNPSFAYDFGKKLSPPEGRGNLLRLSVFPTGERTLRAIARHDV